MSAVALVLRNNSISGAEKRLIRFYFESQKLKKDFYLILNKGLLDEALKDTEISSFINSTSNNVFILPEIKMIPTIISSSIYLAYYLKKKKIKTIHLALGALKFAFLKNLLSIKILAEITSPDIADKICLQNFDRYRKNFDYTLCVSPSVHKKIFLNLRKRNIEPIETFASPIPFFNKPIAVECPKQNIITYASRFIERKNPLVFAHAIDKFLNSNNEWKVNILGKGPLQNDIEAVLDKHIITGKVNIQYTSDILSFFNISQIYVSIIDPDNYPSQSILEAMHLKNVILASNTGDTNIFVGPENGILIDELNPDNLHSALVELTSLSSLETLQIESKEKATRKFDKKIYLNNLFDIYSKLS